MEHEFIEGTGKKLDYIVIAKNGKVRLALKPIVENLVGETSRHLTLIGFRLRSVPMPGETCTEDELCNAWPNVQFHAINVVRASTTVGGVVDRSDVATGDMMTTYIAEQGVAKSFAKGIIDLAGENLLYSEEQIEQFLAETFGKIATANAPENAFDAAAIAKGANVIDLHSAALSKAVDKSKLN